MLAGDTELGSATDSSPLTHGGIGLGIVNLGDTRDSVGFDDVVVTTR